MSPGLHFELHGATVFIVVACISAILVNFRDAWWHARTPIDIQQGHSTHITPTPRLGGVAILSACAVLIALVDGVFGDRYMKFVLAMLPMAVVCLYEDAMRPTPATLRLFATVASTILCLSMLKVQLPRVDIELIDPFMGGLFGYALTVIFVSSTVNAFNMIDGLNGLCAIVSASALLAISAISSLVQYQFLAHTSMTLFAAILGFVPFNFPRGRLFLGDTGAYILGFVIVWFGISLIYRQHEVSAWAVFLILAYPISEISLTAFRRLLLGSHPFVADRRHLHHLVLIGIARLNTSPQRQWRNNPLATLLVLPIALAPMGVAVLFYGETQTLIMSFVVYFILYASVYFALRRLYRAMSILKD